MIQCEQFTAGWSDHTNILEPPRARLAPGQFFATSPPDAERALPHTPFVLWLDRVEGLAGAVNGWTALRWTTMIGRVLPFRF